MARPVSINEEEILAAARRVFMRRGYGASSIQLARAAGVSEGSLFRHFKTKAALFMKAMGAESTGPAWTENLMASVGRGEVRVTLETAGRQLLEHLQVILPRVMMIRSSGILLQGTCHRDEKVPRPVQLARGLARYFRKEIELGRLVMSSPDTYAHAFVGALSHYVFCETLFNYRPAPPPIYVHTVVDAIVKTTAVPSATARPKRKEGLRKMRSLAQASGIAVLAGALCVGCVSNPTPGDPVTQWTPPDRARKADPVWASVRSQTNDFSRPLALADLTDVALRNNPATVKAWHDARAAYEQVKQARGYFMPTVTAVAAGSMKHTSASPSGFDLDRTQYGPALQLNYLVINFGGGQRAAVEQALQTVFAANCTMNQTLQGVLFAVQSAYYGVLSAQSAVEASEAGVRDAQVVLEAAQESLKQGLGTRLAVLQAQAGHDQALYAEAAARGGLRTVQSALAQAVGVPGDTAIRIEPPTNRVPQAIAVGDIRRFIDESLARRPDIGALRANLAAREAAVTVAGASLWPSLYLDGSLSETVYDSKTESQPMQDRNLSYGAGISLRWTLFDGLQTLSAKRAAREQAESARAALRQAELAASADVWARHEAYASALEKHRFSEAFLASASSSYDLALQSYRAQLSSLLDLLHAETQLAQARTQLVAARQEVFTALAGLAYATGLLEKGGADTSFPTLGDKEKKP